MTAPLSKTVPVAGAPRPSVDGAGALADLAARCLHDAYLGLRTGGAHHIHAARRSAQAFGIALELADDGTGPVRVARRGVARDDRTLEALIQTGAQLASNWNGRPLELSAAQHLDQQELQLHAMAAHLVDVLDGSAAADQGFLEERLDAVLQARGAAVADCVAAAQRAPSRMIGEAMRELKVAHLLEQAAREIVEGLAPYTAVHVPDGTASSHMLGAAPA